MPGLWRKISANCGNEQEKAGSDAFFATTELITSCLFCHICCAVAQSVGVDHRSAPFARHPVRAERTRRFSMLYAFVSRRKAVLLVVHGRVQRCPWPCATLHTPMDNEPAPFLKWIFPRNNRPFALCAPSVVSCPLRRCLLGLTKRSGLGLPNEKASHFHFYSSRLAFNLDKIGCGSAEQR